MIRSLAFGGLALYAGLGTIAGISLGAEWLRSVNRAGFPAVSMLLPAWGLLIAALVLRYMEGRGGDVGRFYARLAWAAAAGAGMFSRVGWFGRWPENAALEAVDMALAAFTVLAVLLALLAVARVTAASTAPVVRWTGRGLLLSTGAVAVYCVFDIATGLAVRLPPISASALGLVTLIGLPLAALAAAFLLPHRRRSV